MATIFTASSDNQVVHAEDGMGRLPIENQSAVPGDGRQVIGDEAASVP